MLIGKTVRSVRAMTKQEVDLEGWYRGTTVIEFTDGTKIYASQDEEGNGPGTIFGEDNKGAQFYVFPPRKG